MKAITNLVRRLNGLEPEGADDFLRKITGIIHVGANTGQESAAYAELGLEVLWIEPIPDVYAKLCENIAPHARQRALQALVTDEDDAQKELFIANNGGASSSIFDFHEHKDIWPQVAYTGSIQLKSMTLATLLRRNSIDPSPYQAMLLDTQGAELLVLKGSVSLLEGIRYIKTEVADFESYKGCCQLRDIEAFMARHGYAEVARSHFASRAQGGDYYDIVYKRKRWA